MTEEKRSEVRDRGEKILQQGVQTALWVVATLVLFFFALALLAPQPGKQGVSEEASAATTTPESKSAVQRNPEEYKIRRSIANCLAQPAFSGDDLAKKLFGVDLEVGYYMVDKDKVSFMLPIDSYEKGIEKKVSLDPDSVEWARLKDHPDEFFVPAGSRGTVVLGGEEYGIIPETFLFSVPVADLGFDVNKRLGYRFGNVIYDISPNELHGFITNQVVKCGSLKIHVGGNTYMHNRACFIVNPGEPSFSRLAGRICGNYHSKEAKIQALLDFVNLEINYADSDHDGIPVLKRPNETLMVEAGDCGNRVILFASLLEQIGVDYVILYLPEMEHASIAVSGNFPKSNGLNFSFGNKDFFVAEPTVTHSRFTIGQDLLPGMRMSSIGYVQLPDQKVWSVKDGRWIS